MDAWFNDIRSQACGGNCKLLPKIITGLGKRHHMYDNLNLPAYKIPNHIRMTNHQRVRIFFLASLGTVKVLAVCRLYTGPILEELL